MEEAQIAEQITEDHQAKNHIYSNNHPFIVWSSCFLWFMSIFSITWSMILFCSLGDMLILSGLDIVNAFTLLSGLIMVPANVYILYSIAHGNKLSRESNVLSCPLWLCVVWIIMVNSVAAFLCAKQIFGCHENTTEFIENSMKYYRTCPKYKRFMDNIQWVLQCCGHDSYTDWFRHDWYDKIRDYEWDPSSNKRRQTKATDSVPLSCCKSGSCISNYLIELGTHSINTRGCTKDLEKIIMVMLILHLILFLLVVADEMLLLRFMKKQGDVWKGVEPESEDTYNKSNVKCTCPKYVQQLLVAKDNFEASSLSYQINPDDSDEEFVKEPQNKTSNYID